MKVCSKCDVEKPESEFYKRKYTRDGLRGECKICFLNDSKRYYREIQKDPIRRRQLLDIHSSYQRRRRKEHKHLVLNRLRCRLRGALKCNTKSTRTKQLIGCSPEFLIEYLEAGKSADLPLSELQIDHIIPCAKYDFSDPENAFRCFSYMNLQAITKEENLKKRDRMPPVDELRYLHHLLPTNLSEQYAYWRLV